MLKDNNSNDRTTYELQVKERRGEGAAKASPNKGSVQKKRSKKWKALERVFYLGTALVWLGLWLGAQVDGEARRQTLSQWGQQMYINNATIDYTLQILDATYQAVDHTKATATLWAKVAILVGTPLVSLLLWCYQEVQVVSQFMAPYLVVLWEYAKVVGEWLGPYLAIGRDVALEYLVLGRDVALEYASLLLAVLVNEAKGALQQFLAQDRKLIMYEVGSFVGGIFLLYMIIHDPLRIRQKASLKYRAFRAYLVIQYKNLIQEIKKKSLLAAAMLPHLLLIVPVLAAGYFINEFWSQVSQEYILTLLLFVYPFCNSVYCVEYPKSEKDNTRCLMYWVVLAVLMAFRGLIPYVPFGYKMVEAIPYLQEAFIVFMIWLQLPWTDGSFIMYRLFIPWVDRLLQKLPFRLNPLQEKINQNSSILSTIINLFVPEKWRPFITDILFQSTFILLSLPFFITPPYFTGLACLFFGVAFPYYGSISTLANSTSNPTHNTNNTKPDPSAQQQELPPRPNPSPNAPRPSPNDTTYWIKYWIIYISFSLLHESLSAALYLDVVPFWYQIKLAIIIWLQLPIFKGATAIYDRTAAVFHKIPFFSKKKED